MASDYSTIRLSILGRPVVVRSSDRPLLATAAEAYAHCGSASPPDGPAISLELIAAEQAGRDPPRIEVDGTRLRMTLAGLESWADARTLAAVGRVSRDLVGRPADLAGDLTDTLLLFLLTRSGRIPLHAAGVVCGGAAVLLAGPSGSGKSTLSLAAVARGLQILSDDTVYIQLQPRMRIWGFPRPLHVFPADARGFIQGVRLRGGKLKAIVPVPGPSKPPVADKAVVVLLERGEAVRLEPVARSVATAALSRLEPGFDLLAKESAEAVAAVTAQGAWRLTLSRNPAAAIEALVDRLGGALAAAPT